MKLSAGLIVALFCTAIIVNPVVLLSLFSQATNVAVSGIVSLWDASALASLIVPTALWQNTVNDMMMSAAVDLQTLLLANRSSGSSGNGEGALPLASLGTMLTLYASLLSTCCEEPGRDGGTQWSLVLLERVQGIADAAKAAKVVLAAASNTSVYRHRSDNGTGADEMIVLDRFGAVAQVIPVLSNSSRNNVSHDAAQSHITVESFFVSSLVPLDDLVVVAPSTATAAFLLGAAGPSSQCRTVADAVANLVDVNDTLDGSIAAAVLRGNTWFSVPVTADLFLVLLASPPASSYTVLSCADVGATASTQVSYSGPTSFLIDAFPLLNGVTVLLGASAETFTKGRNNSSSSSSSEIGTTATAGNAVALYNTRPNWMLATLLGARASSSGTGSDLEFYVRAPQPYCVYLVSISVAQGGPLQNVAALSCFRSGSEDCCKDSSTAGDFGAVLGQAGKTLLLPGQLQSMGSPFVFDRAGDYFVAGVVLRSSNLSDSVLPMRNGSIGSAGKPVVPQSSSNTTTGQAGTEVTNRGDVLGLVLAVPSSTSLATLDRAMANSVIVSVSLTAVVFVVALSVLFYLFHPLKVAGSLLRNCAEVRMHELERQTPSFMAEILLLQRAVDQLIRRIRLVGNHLPDKTQLHAMLHQDATVASEHPGGGGGGGKHDDNPWAVALRQQLKQQSSQLLGSVAHSITVHVEYRSRRHPSKERKAQDLRKNCSFEFVYSAQDSLVDLLLRQCRERLNERVGEELQLYDKGTGGARRGASLNDCVPIRSDEELLAAIERSATKALYLVVLKRSEKRAAVWLAAALSIVDVGLLTNAGVFLFNLPDADPGVARCGLVIILLITARMVGNTASALYLIRLFTTLHPPLSQWVPQALQETLVVVLVSSASLSNLSLLFSHIRITAQLRFNAPNSTALFRPIMHRWYTWSLVVGDLAPLACCVFAWGQLVTYDGRLFFAVLSATVSLVYFAVEHSLPQVISRLHHCCGRQDGFGGTRRNLASMVQPFDQRNTGTALALSRPSNSENDLTEELLSRRGSVFFAQSEHEADNNDSELLSGEHSAVVLDEVDSSSPMRSPLPGSERRFSPVASSSARVARGADAASTSSGRPPSAPRPVKSLYLGLCRRSVSVLCLSLHRSAAYFDAMDSVEIQQVCSAYLSLIFRETKAHGGIVLSVSNSDVTIGFNCHQYSEHHLEEAISCFLAIAQALPRQLLRWSEDIPDTPRLCASLVTGDRLTIGFAGCGDARAFQLLGKARRELECLARLGQYYGTSLTCNSRAAELIDESAAFTTPRSSFAFSALTDGGGGGTTTDDVSRPTNLVTRLIDLTCAIENSALLRNGHATRSAIGQHRRRPPHFAVASTLDLCRVYEVLWHDGAEAMVLSSRTALGFLDTELQALQAPSIRQEGALDSVGAAAHSVEKQATADAAAPGAVVVGPFRAGAINGGASSTASPGAKPAAPVSPEELLRGHLQLYPTDIVARRVLIRAFALVTARHVSSLGIDIADSERQEQCSEVGHQAMGAAVGSALRAAEVATGGERGTTSMQHSPVLQKMAATKKYVLHFTDL